MDLLRTVNRITVESAYGPQIVVDDPFGAGRHNLVLAALRPRITVDAPGGPYVAEPYGPPGPTRWPWVKVGLFALGVLALVGGARVARQLAKRA